MGVLGRLFSTAWKIVAGFLGRSFEEWAEWASREPVAAALELETIAALLEGRSRAYREPNGWRGRRDRSIAEALRVQARQLRTARSPNDLEQLCKIVPGTASQNPPPPAVRSGR